MDEGGREGGSKRQRGEHGGSNQGQGTGKTSDADGKRSRAAGNDLGGKGKDARHGSKGPGYGGGNHGWGNQTFQGSAPPNGLGMIHGLRGPGVLPDSHGPMVGRGRGRGGGQKRNDYCQHFVDTGQRPQNFLRDIHLVDRYEEYPKLKELIDRKDDLISARATPPMYKQCDLKRMPLSVETLGTKFDVILVDPPWEEYERRAPGMGSGRSWTWQEIMSLKVEDIAETPSFVLLWCGAQEGLDAGRHILRKWGFRRCEDICWLKANLQGSASGHSDQDSVLQHTKEHCLMGIKGTVRRATDGHVIHANIDTDIIVTEEPPHGSTAKPEELYRVIERFCLGRRRLELCAQKWDNL